MQNVVRIVWNRNPNYISGSLIYGEGSRGLSTDEFPETDTKTII